MTWQATLGLALLVYTPMAYLLLRGGYRRRMWAGTAVVVTFAVAPGLGATLPGSGSLLATVALAGWLAAIAAIGFRPLVRGASYRAPVTAGQLVVVGVVARLLGSALLPLSPPALAATDPATLAVTFAARTPPESLAVTAADLHAGAFAVGLVVFLVGVGNAHVHGGIGGDADSTAEPRTWR